VFARHGLHIFDVQELATHGGSLRIYAQLSDSGRRPVTDRVSGLLERERRAELDQPDAYRGFSDRVQKVKRSLLSFLIRQKNEGRSVVGYGAPAKGNTLLNYCGIGPDLLEYTVDRSPHKQGMLLPGSRIPIHPPEVIAETKPDFLLILPWNLEAEIVEQQRCIRQWGGRFVVPIPDVRVID
jgi:hypothetical protein